MKQPAAPRPRRAFHRPLLLPLLLLVPAACAPATPAAAPAPAPAAATPAPAAAVTAEQAAANTRALNAYLDEVFRAELAYSPQAQTQFGMIEDLEAYGRWNDPSEAAQLASRERQRGYLATMRERFDPATLDEAGRTTFRFLEYQNQIGERLWEVRESAFVFSPMLDAVSGLTAFMINAHRVAEPAHAEAYISRLSGMAGLVDTLSTRAERRHQAGTRLPAFAYPRLITSAQGLLTGAPFQAGAADGALLADFRAKVGALEIPAAERAALIARAESALRDQYQPAVQRYVAALRRMETDAPRHGGARSVPDGERFYAAQVALFTTRDDLTAAQIHRIGLSEVERIQGEMREIMRAVGFTGTLQEFFEHLRTDDRFYYPDSAEGRQRYLDESTRYIERVMEVAPRFFNRLPRAPLEVRAVEAFREETAAGAFYNQPSLDGSRPGYYYVNLRNMRDNPTYLMESLAYHEGAPGHHFQLALAQELQDLPMLQRLTFFSAYVEGWALYAELLGKDMGFFTDPYQDFGRLSYELFRAVRLVVDTGIHDQGWTREQAIAYMLENTPMTEGDITPEVERYIVWPAQALSYKIGMNTIVDLRDRAMAELGNRFDWGGFHDAVLTAGSLPLPLLEERVERWIESVR
jgi:uncharacterized protein (DUF885 family)